MLRSSRASEETSARSLVARPVCELLPLELELSERVSLLRLVSEEELLLVLLLLLSPPAAELPEDEALLTPLEELLLELLLLLRELLLELDEVRLEESDTVLIPAECQRALFGPIIFQPAHVAKLLTCRRSPGQKVVSVTAQRKSAPVAKVSLT